MRKIMTAIAAIAALGIAGCKEPVEQAAAPAPAPEVAAESPETGAEAVVGIAPSPADTEFPAGPATLQFVNEYCNIESINGKTYMDSSATVVSSSAAVDVVGWIVDKSVDQVPTGLNVIIEKVDLSHRWKVAPTTGLPREDVAEYNKFPASLVNSGFSAQVDMSGFEKGLYHLFLTYSANGKTVGCDNARQITLE